MNTQIGSGIIGMDMGMHGVVVGNSATQAAAAAEDLRRGPWTVEEDLLLVNYIVVHGEGRWNSLARSAGLKRSGKSCRLRWLNYLRPDVRRGNITAEEQLIILELQSRWGNRWSKIAQHLPGRTDNEIKNYWRTRVQKHAKLLKCDINSQQFRDVVRYLWMPRLMERIRVACASSSAAAAAAAAAAVDTTVDPYAISAVVSDPMRQTDADIVPLVSLGPDRSSMEGSLSDLSAETQLSRPPVSTVTDCYIVQEGNVGDFVGGFTAAGCSESLLSPCGYLYNQGFPDFEQSGWGEAGGFSSENLWDADGVRFLQQQL